MTPLFVREWVFIVATQTFTNYTNCIPQLTVNIHSKYVEGKTIMLNLKQSTIFLLLIQCQRI